MEENKDYFGFMENSCDFDLECSQEPSINSYKDQEEFDEISTQQSEIWYS